MDFIVPTNYRIKIKETDKRDEYLDPVKEVRTLQNKRDNDSNCNRRAWKNLKKTEKHSKYWLLSDRNEMINIIISEYNKLA